MSNDLTKKPDNAVALDDAFNIVGATGFENVNASDLLIPRLTILQGLSPQVTRGKPEYDPEARVGDIYDIGLQERFPEGVEIVVAHYNKAWLQWGPRGSNKPPIIHETDDILEKATANERNQPTLANGDYIAETAQFYCVNLTTPDRRKTFIPMASTQLKKARRLLTLAQSERVSANGEERVPPLFWRSYFLTTVPESNAMGNWMGWKVERGPLLKDRDNYQIILKEIKDLREAVVEGRAHGDLGGESGEGAM